MATILTVANIHFNGIGSARIDHTNGDNVVRVSANAIMLAAGPTADRNNNNEEGLIRYNTTFGRLEVYDSTGWKSISNAAITATGVGANAYSDSILASAKTEVGTGANTFLLATLTGANTAVGTGANTFLLATLSGANTTVGTGANTYLQRILLANTTTTLAGSLTVTETVLDSNGSFRIIPASATTTTLVKGDVGKYVPITGTIAIPSGVFSAGDAVSIYNNSGTSQSITTSAVTCYLAGTATTTSPRTLAQRGVVTILCVGSNEFVITGSGIS